MLTSRQLFVVILLGLGLSSLSIIVKSMQKKDVGNSISYDTTFSQTIVVGQEAKLKAESVICSSITHSANEFVYLDKNSPHIIMDMNPPDCERVIDAWLRAKQRLRAHKVYSVELIDKVHASDVFFYRPRLHYLSEYKWPVIDTSQDSSTRAFARGTTNTNGPVLIQYSYEEVIEHEATHAIGRLIDPTGKRLQFAIAQDQNMRVIGGIQFPMIYKWQILCHNTIDDVAGDGPIPSGERDGCQNFIDKTWSGYGKP